MSCLLSVRPFCSWNAACNHLNWSLQKESRNQTVSLLCLKFFKGFSLPKNKPQILEFLTHSPAVLGPLCPLPFHLSLLDLVISCSEGLLSLALPSGQGSVTLQGLASTRPCLGGDLWTCPGPSCGMNTFSVPTAFHGGLHSGRFCSPGNSDISISSPLNVISFSCGPPIWIICGTC